MGRKPAQSSPPLRIVRISGEALTHGVETHEAEGATVKLFSVAKTIADLFKYRNKRHARVGLYDSLEALREAIRTQRATTDEVLRAAKVCRVEKVMRPYLEGLQ
ncbi:MAG: hypothetical protein U0572_08025 [Phycisphaerales bacterium]